MTGAAVAAATLGTAGAQEMSESTKEASSGVSSWIMVGAFDWTQAFIGVLMLIIVIQAVAIFVLSLVISSKQMEPKVVVVNQGQEMRGAQEVREERAAEERPAPQEPIPEPQPEAQQVPPPVPEVATGGARRLLTVAQTGQCYHIATCPTLRHSTGLRHLRGCNICKPE